MKCTHDMKSCLFVALLSQIFPKEVMSEEEEDRLLNRKVRVIRVDSFRSSDTSFDSSLSSDLEVRSKFNHTIRQYALFLEND